MEASNPELTGKALEERARELDIKGRGDMSADELRAAVAEAEDAAPASREPAAIERGDLPEAERARIGGPQSVEGYTPPDGDELLGTGKGYIGNRVDPFADSEHSLESGPDAPSALDQAVAAKVGEVEALAASAGHDLEDV